ncbi:ABC transporter ATP-binding protein [Dactylosporangium sucinum]|uniref:ABC transporter ATP-binding protein n=1 Tax=Dactylosporangium sucinum TaxID=1424081 RepID=A0A917X4D9_9ACTN|nr:ABC transporter ATP-binding protein [Dactylosporangium sucinum]GGM64587.1 ABC transporter ATP-binding protein [Dactylosporangium sucinum]
MTTAIAARPALSVSRLTVNYGLARALSDVSFDVAQGSCVAVLGANGAGKTTLARAITGLVPLREGKVLLDGQDITGWATHRIARLGVTHVPAERMILPGLSVLDNLRAAMRWAVPRNGRAAAIERAFERFPVLGSRAKQLAGTLSGGEQQMLSLARALAVPPKLVIADELSHGLAPMLVASVFEALAQIRAQGSTVVIIEQFVGAALELADEAVILRRGELAWSGPASVAGDQLAANYLE